MSIKMKAEQIFNKIEKKYKGRGTSTRVFIVDSESSRTKSTYKKIQSKKTRSKILWIRVETNRLRVEVRKEIADMFNIKNFYTSSRSSIDQIRIIDFDKTDNIAEIRIILKPFGMKNYKWQNQFLIDKLGKSKIGTPDNIDEVKILKEINTKIFNMGGSVTLRIKNKNYKDVIGFNAAPSGAKADFEIINSIGDSIGWISYKSGNTSKDFQQYGGITKHAGEEIYNHPQVKKFREKIVNDKQIQTDIKEKKKFAFIRIKRSNTLKNRAVFGKEFGRKKGIHNVDWFAQGNLIIRDQENTLNITFSKKLVENGRVYQLNRDYDPVIAARKGEASRNITIDVDKETKLKAPGIRGGIFPQGLIDTRKDSIDMSGF
jgi:hypothetical protein